MRILQSISERFDHLWAALIFFTRLPFWRLHQPRPESYQAVVEYWPLAGWLTAGCMAGVLYGASLIFTYDIAIILAIASRLLLTGALHEDGLADFFDGFGGGGSNRQRVLEIMKDSHIGTFGVLALIFYILTLFFALQSLAPTYAALMILVADPLAKMISAWSVQLLPYARTAETAKNRIVYRKFSIGAGFSLILQGLMPFLLYIFWNQGRVACWALFCAPLLMVLALTLFIRKRLGGYTGDCCGALCLLAELSVYLVASVYMSV